MNRLRYYHIRAELILTHILTEYCILLVHLVEENQQRKYSYRIKWLVCVPGLMLYKVCTFRRFAPSKL